MKFSVHLVRVDYTSKFCRLPFAQGLTLATNSSFPPHKKGVIPFRGVTDTGPRVWAYFRGPPPRPAAWGRGTRAVPHSPLGGREGLPLPRAEGLGPPQGRRPAPNPPRTRPEPRRAAPERRRPGHPGPGWGGPLSGGEGSPRRARGGEGLGGEETRQTALSHRRGLGRPVRAARRAREQLLGARCAGAARSPSTDLLLRALFPRHVT